MNRKKNILVSLLLALTLIMQPFTALGIKAEETSKYVTVCIERFTLGQGYFIEPTLVEIEDGDTAADALLALFQENNIQYESSGSVAEQTFYLSSIKDADTGVLNIPSYITANGGPSNEDNDGNSDSFLGEFDYSSMSGWMITVNNSMINVGSSAYEVEDGDVIRWAFTLWGYGADLGYSNDWGSTAYYNEPDRTDLIRSVAKAKAKGSSFISANQNVYNTALTTAANVNATQAEVDSANTALAAALTGVTSASASVTSKSLDYSIQNATDMVAQYLLNTVTEPAYGSMGGEWVVLQLARSGHMTKEFKSTYLTNLTEYVKNKEGVLSTSKLTEYSRVIIALSALNEDATDFAGYNLVKPLANYTNTVKQGINGAIYALIALDTKNYVIPEVEDGGVQTTRENLIQYILDKEITGGGWALTGTTPDPDITAMAIQSLSAYYTSNAKVKTAVDAGISILASIQNDEGGYASWGTVNSESVAQVICALCSLGIDPAKDSRFVKEDGSWLLSSLFSFAVPTGGTLAFAHTGTTANQMATEQAGYALAAYNRLLKGESFLYDMKTVSSSGNTADSNTITASTSEASVVVPDFVEAKAGAEFNVILRAGKYIDDLKMMDGSFSIAENLEVEKVTMSSNISGGTLNWNVADQVLRFVYGDFSSGESLVIADKTQSDVLTITLKLKSVTEGQTTLPFSMLTFREMEDSQTYESLSDSNHVESIPLVSYSVVATVLYEGDGSDIIPKGKKAVRIDVAGVDLGKYELDFSIDGKEYSKLYISKDFSDYYGHTIYVMIVDKNVTENQLNDADNYSVFAETAATTLQFADTNQDGVVDAQDALNEVSLWLRKVEKDITSDLILTYNVNADERIDSLDALAIVESFVSSKQYAVMGK